MEERGRLVWDSVSEMDRVHRVLICNGSPGKRVLSGHWVIDR